MKMPGEKQVKTCYPPAFYVIFRRESGFESRFDSNRKAHAGLARGHESFNVQIIGNIAIEYLESDEYDITEDVLRLKSMIRRHFPDKSV